MRVLLTETVSELGGAQWSLFELAVQLVRDGVDVCVAAPQGPLLEKLTGANVPVAAIPTFRARRNALALFIQFFAGAKGSAQIRKAARRFKPEIVHANSITAGIVSLPLARKHAFVCHVRDLRFPIKPMVQIAQQARRVIANSEAVDGFLSEFLRRSQRSRLTRVVNGIDLAYFKPGDTREARQRCGLPQDVPLIGMIAHLAPWKRHDRFIEMAAVIAQQRPDVHFVIVGRDLLGENKAYRTAMRQLASERGVGKTLHWFEDISDPRDILQALDILVHPPHDEPFGRVLCEAMAMEKPVVALQHNGPAAIVENGKTGLFVATPTPDLFTKAVFQLLDNPSQAAAFGAAGRERVKALFNIERTAREMRAVYQSALDEQAQERDAQKDDS